MFDQACQLRGRVNTPGGNLQLAIELGPRVVLGPAPPVIDWMPGESVPLDAADVPCAPL